MRFFRSFAVVIALLSGLSAHADEGWTDLDLSSARLIAAQTAAPADGSLQVGIDIRLNDGWKTYWRTPGDAGYPVTVDWSGSDNAEPSQMQWPAPHRFSLFDLDTFGYGERIVFPVNVDIPDPTQPVLLNAVVDYLLCKEICVPQVATVSLTLDPGTPSAGLDAQLIDLYQSQVPGDGSQSGLSLDEVTLSDTGNSIAVRVTSVFPLTAPDVIVEGPEDVLFSRPAVDLQEDGLGFTATLDAETFEGTPADLSGKDLTLTIVDGTRGLEAQLDTAALAQAAVGISVSAFLGFVGIAFVGGMILNLMPCVLPVLSIKLLSVVSHGGHSPARVRLSFMASAMGILASFWVLALGAVALRSVGVAVGWGIQFQNPYFLVFMAIVVTVFAYNLLGMFEIPLPKWMSGTAQIGNSDTLKGHFLTGVFATLLATPCSAPFVGTAIGFALSSGTFEILAIFTALGVGLAAPFLLVAVFPGLATSMPKPGKWMLTMKKVLGLALAATTVWLLFVIAGVSGQTLAIVVSVGLVVMGAALWTGRSVEGRGSAIGATLAIVALALMFSPSVITSSQAGASSVATADFGVFSIAERDRLVSAGEIVFVDVTADWCITCQVNKRVALSDGEVRAALEAEGVAPLQADWTQRDDSILSYLTSHGRYGIPFNVVYGPGAPEGIVLPELLSPGAVLDALREAQG
ncbi:protein-disulfide reductase DsbD domain-containing protein [uncultured Tateyamaria sp.]|uniref:protein-disulfide reductase DsbD family protein n=1 Tax=uncultured Tateyamaria sp. TaxID=455651 RepID=UPI00263116DF|nr:protein-disulfide reductase DsbD domain-containing protein [uncultured Tateyamaria sp.]